MSASPTTPIIVVAGWRDDARAAVTAHLRTALAGRGVTVVRNRPDDVSGAVIDTEVIVSGGCVCCTAAGHLIESLAALPEDAPSGVVLIDAAAVADPAMVGLVLQDELLTDRFGLASIVTVVDADHFAADYAATGLLLDDDGDPLSAALAPHLVEQIESANVVVITGTGGGDWTIPMIAGYAGQLAPGADIVAASDGTVGAEWLLAVDRHGEALADAADRDDAESDPVGWTESTEPDDLGFHALTWHRDAPLDWNAFLAILEDWPDEVLRCRGQVAFASHPPALISMVCDTCEVTVLDDHDHDHDHDHGHDHTATDVTELVFIGRHMPIDTIVARLESCLVR